MPAQTIRPKLWTLAATVMSIVAITAVGTIVYQPFGPKAHKNQVIQVPMVDPSTEFDSPAKQPTASVQPTPPPIPSRHQLTGGTHLFQTFNNCGPAALSMALSYYGVSETQQKLGQVLRPYQQAQGNNDDKSVTLQEVAAKGSEYNLIPYQRPAGTIAILEALVAQDLPVIARTWLKSGEDIGHFRIVTGYDQQQQVLIQDDSLQGKNLSYRYADFEELWAAFNYEFLVLVPPEKQSVVEQILGELSDEQTAWQQALELATTQLAADPTNAYAGFNKAVAQYHLGNYQAAITDYEAVAERLPSRMLWYQLEPVLAYYQLGEYERVTSIAESILNNQNRAYAELYYLQGLIAQHRGQEIQAESAFAKATQYNQSQYWKVNLP